MISILLKKVLLMLAILSYLILFSCEESTKPETVTFSQITGQAGTVTLEGETDYSGVKVSLYKPVELDMALGRINQQYPQIGVQIPSHRDKQETEFDHRKHSASYSTKTNTNGVWEIEVITSKYLI